MLTEAEIKAKYKALHDTLSETYYAGTSELTKAEFDLQHGKIWTDMKAELKAGGFIPEPEPLPIFTPLNPLRGIEQRLTHVEQFLSDRYPSP